MLQDTKTSPVESFRDSQNRFAQNRGEKTYIGRSLVLKGELSGEEDLTIQGTIEGKVRLAQYGVTVGANGRVEGDIDASEIRVEGETCGNLQATEKIVITATGRASGELSAPRVVLEDGCTFKGMIDMDSPASAGDTSRTRETRVKEVEPEDLKSAELSVSNG